MPYRSDGLTLRQAAIIAGLGYLLNPVPYAEFSIMPKLVVMGQPDQTLANIAGHPGLFVTAILCYLINFIGDILIAWALYYLLAPVNRSVSLLAALFRLMYTAIALTGWLKLVDVYRIVTTPAYATTFGSSGLAAQVDLLLHTFRYDWAISIFIFAIHLLLIGGLIFRSTYMPKWLGVLLVVNGVVWIVNSLKPYLYPHANLAFLGFAVWFELIFMLWLLTRGWKIPEPAA